MLVYLGNDHYKIIDDGPPRKSRKRPPVHLGTQWRIIMQLRTSKHSIWYEQEFFANGPHYNDAGRAVLAYIERNKIFAYKPATLFERI